MSGMQNLVRVRETLRDNMPAIGALLLTMAVGMLLSFKLFRWEKEEKMRPQAKLWLVAVFAPFLVLGIWQTQAKTNLQRAKLLDRDLARAHTYLIHDARIFVDDGRVIERGSVLVQEGKIGKIFDGDGPDAKAVNADVIEAAGKTLLPGLIDGRVLLSASGLLANDPDQDAAIDHELAAYLYSGVTCGSERRRRSRSDSETPRRHSIRSKAWCGVVRARRYKPLRRAVSPQPNVWTPPVVTMLSL